MQRVRLLALTFIFMTLTILFATAVVAQDFYAVEDVFPTLKGTGKTVIEGTRIDEFDVEVIDVIPQAGFDGGPMILVKVSGTTVDFSEGIAAGYSGSPVYFNGRLAGAISSAIPGTDTHICGITPIRSMLKALDQGEATDINNNTVLPPAYTQFSTGPGGPVVPTDDEKDEESDESQAPSIKFTSDWESARQNNSYSLAPTAPLYAVPLSGRLLVGGVSQRTFDMLKPILESNPKLKSYSIAAGPSGSGPKGFGLLKSKGDINKLEAGDALAVALVTGDYELAGIGTVTYVDGQNRLLAFGHGMFQQGLVNIPFGKAYISYTYKEDTRGFKDGYLLGCAGTLTYDHAAAVGGLIGMQPDMVDVNINLNDIDRGQRKTYTYQIIRDEDLFESLLYTVAMMSYYEFLDREGGGTIKIGYKIEADGLKTPFERENFFYDNFNAASFIAAEALPTAAFILFNNYRDIRINNFSVNIDITNNRVNASIDKAEIIDTGDRQKDGESVESTEAETTSDETEPAATEDNATNSNQVQESAEVVPPDITAAEEEVPPPDLAVKEFVPGEVVRVKVTLQPYRQDAIVQELIIRIPRDFPTGQTTLIVQGGGGLVSIYNEYGGKGTVLFPIAAGPLPLGPEILELDNTLEKIQKGETNNLLMVVIPRPPTPEQQQAEAQGIPSEEVWRDDEKEVKVTIPTDFVIYDMYMLPINIVKSKSDKNGDNEETPA